MPASIPPNERQDGGGPMHPVDTGRDLLLEGTPGTSKTTLLKSIAGAWGIPLILAEGCRASTSSST